MNIWYRLFDFVLITLETVTFLATFRVTWELWFTPYRLQVGSLIYLPNIFYTCCQSFGSFGQTMMIGLFPDQHCMSFTVTCFIQIAAFGDFGFIAGLCVAVFLPYLGFSRSLALKRLSSIDCTISFFWSVFAVFIIWVLYFYVFTHYGSITQYEHYCFPGIQAPLIIISVQSVAFLGFIFYLWIRGLQIYFQTMYNVDRISISNVVARASMFHSSQDTLECAEQNEIDSEIEGGIQEVIDHYGNQFQWCMYLVLIAQFWFLAGLGFELVGYGLYGQFIMRSGILFRVCNFIFCWIFFRTKQLVQNGRRLVPDCCAQYLTCIFSDTEECTDYEPDGELSDSEGSDSNGVEHETQERYYLDELQESTSELSMRASMSLSVGFV